MTMKKNLSILINSLSGGGAERVVSILLQALQSEYEITLVLMNDTIVYEVPSGVRVAYLENADAKESGILKILKLPLLGWRYSRLCKRLHVDISLSFMYRPNFINVIAMLFGLKAKCIISERNTPSQTYGGKGMASVAGRSLVLWLYPKADLILPNSKGNAHDLVENFAIDPQKIEVIQNPVDVDKIIGLGKESVEDVSFEGKFTFVSVARLEVQKNHDITIRAFAKVPDADTQLLILGAGDQQQSLQALIDELGLQKSVKLLGFVKNPYKYMAKSDCFVLSSSREGFPNVLVEALACGLYVISSDCKSGPKEILEDSKLGMLYKVGDVQELEVKMRECMSAPMDKEKIKKQNLARLEEFGLEKIVERFKRALKYA